MKNMCKQLSNDNKLLLNLNSKVFKNSLQRERKGLKFKTGITRSTGLN